MSNQQHVIDHNVELRVGDKLKLEIQSMPGTLESFVVVKAFNLKEELEKAGCPLDPPPGSGPTEQMKLSSHLINAGLIQVTSVAH